MTAIELGTYRHVLSEVRDGIAVVTMNRPEKRNALSVEHMEELTEVFQRIGQEPEIAVAILRGAGPVFCAGHDLNELATCDARTARQIFQTCTTLMQTIRSIPQPVIAQVHGVATAAGFQLAATCDLIVAAAGTRFQTPGVKIGLFCSTPMVAVSRVLPPKKTLELLLTGEPITAEEAAQLGMVNRVVPLEELEKATWELADKIRSASRYVVGIGKQAFYRQLELPEHLAYAYAMEVMTLNALAEDAREGICAFLEKRQPEWRNA
jgi:enoyl-CoA hydratase/carnithine racemase|uniref:Enoyl-CoA hydratase domain-containing protein 3, mitochondrial n=1 Tax=Thermomicrobium roseum TaxID=500 RepID=A0A7C1G1K0_THERO